MKYLVALLCCTPLAGQAQDVTIVTPGQKARLCPTPNCGWYQDIARIPEGTTLAVRGFYTVPSDGFLPPVEWYEVTYQGKQGWVSKIDVR